MPDVTLETIDELDAIGGLARRALSSESPPGERRPRPSRPTGAAARTTSTATTRRTRVPLLREPVTLLRSAACGDSG